MHSFKSFRASGIIHGSEVHLMDDSTGGGKRARATDIPTIMFKPSPMDTDLNEVKRVLVLDNFNYTTWLGELNISQLKVLVIYPKF